MRHRNMKYGLCFCLAQMLAVVVWSQPAIIKGSAPYYKGEMVSVFTYKDFITHTPLQLVSGTVSDSGSFVLELDSLTHSTYIYLSIGNYKADMYVLPGHNYRVEFPAPDTTRYENPYIEHNVELTFYINDTLEINSLIMDFNDQFDKFWVKNYQNFVRREPEHCLDSFYNAMLARYKDVQNPDFRGYFTYSIAELENNTLESPRELGEKYLAGKPILYNNAEYMQFFNDYFKDYMHNLMFTREGGDINKFITRGDYADLMELLKINHLLRNDSLCELVLLKGLDELYYSGDYDKDNIKITLNEIAENTKINEDRIIAQDMLASFSGIIQGGQAPDFALKTSQGDVSSILDYRGKYLYLAFFKTSSTSSVSQMQVAMALYKKYRKKINFVFISEDDNYNDLLNFLNTNKSFNWNFLWDEKHRVMEEYEVKILPEYFLIDPEGRFFRSPADDPSHGIEITFDDIMKPKK